MQWVAGLLMVVLLASSAHAEGCTKSREYILEGLAGDLPASPAHYQDLFKICIQALSLPNVKDAYLLKDGGIALIPKTDSVLATAETLARFCRRFPRNTARFVTARERKHRTTVGLIVLLSSTGSATCEKIRGLM